MNPRTPSTRSLRRRLWRHFDRWALLAVIGLQAAILAMRWTGKGGGARSEASEDERAGLVAAAGAGSSAAAPRLSASAGTSRSVAALPVAFGGHPRRSPASVESAGAGGSWEVLRLSPALDMRETAECFELRLSVPSGVSDQSVRAHVVGRRVDLDVPLQDASGESLGRIFRQVLLPSPPSEDCSPRIERTNGILRVFLDKPVPAAQP